MKGYIKVIRPFKTRRLALKSAKRVKKAGVTTSYRIVKTKKGYFLHQKPKKKGYKY